MVFIYTKPPETQPTESPRSSDDSDQSSDEGQDDATVLLNELADVIDRLYRFAVQVRSPKRRLQSKRANKFQLIDEETGAELIQLFKEFDRQHVSQIFHDIRSRPLEDSGPVLSGTFESTSGDLDNILIHRLAGANTARRQQFAYWKTQKAKISAETTKALQNPNLKPKARTTREHAQPTNDVTPVADQRTNTGSQPATATTLPQSSELKFDDNVSNTSGMTVSPAAETAIDDIVQVPDPPVVEKGTRHFTCPYCFFLCPISFLQKPAWR